MSSKFTDLNAGTIGAGSIFAQAQEPALSGDPYTSTKVSATQIANYVAKGQAFPELNNQTLIQALTGGSGAGTVILTMAEYLALTPAQQSDGHIYVISDFACLFCYGRQYRAMQKLTQAQYDQLSSAEKNDGTLYIITDAATSIGDADDVDLTGLAAGNILRAVSDGQGGIIFKPFVFNVSTSDNNKLLGAFVENNEVVVKAVGVTTGTVTAGSNVTITQSSIKKYGNVVTLGFKFKTSNPTRWATILNFNSDFAPTGDYIYFALDNTSSSSGTQTAHANVYENRVRLGNLLPDANQEYGGCVTWIL